MEIKISGNSHLKDKANAIIKESKKKANEWYEEGRDKMADVTENVKEYSDLMIQKVTDRPVASTLLLSGIALIILSIFVKR